MDPQSTENILHCQLAALVVLLPLAGFVVQVFFGTRIPPRERQGDWIPTSAVLGSLLISTFLMLRMLSSEHGVEPEEWQIANNWINVSGESGAGGFKLHFGILVDNFTIAMLFVVTLVSFCVHLYSWGYMHGEERYNRFFAFLGLFTFSMLGMCVSNNLLFVFCFWELVGVCSYFLIGFYYEKESAQKAAIKAFVTTRLGDLGFLLGMLIIASQVGSLGFRDIFQSVGEGSWEPALLTFAAIALFVGPIGKSAQFPLHVWLPDAMEGPTPVSALIHAATMVVAGVYLVARMFPFMAGALYFQGDFFQSDAFLVVALVGGFTAFFAATIAFSQTDIKKVLAYSTVSQLGYMMLGIGVGSITAGIFHLFTHAFFKALLFLGSGSVIHAVHSNELADMGGLRKKLPITSLTFAIGTLAIAGLPFLSGFYSKEAILGQAVAFAEHRGGVAWLPFLFGIVTAGMTAFYMARLYLKTFEGTPRNQHAYEHAHESPWTMTVPLGILAVLSVVAGGVLPGFSHWFEARVASEHIVGYAGGAESAVAKLAETAHHHHSTVLSASIAMFVAGIGLAALFFAPKGLFYGKEVCRAGTPFGYLNHFLKELWYIDRFYTWLVMRLVHTAQVVCGAFDKHVIDGFVNLWATITQIVTCVVGRVDYWGVDGSVRGLGDGTLWGGRKMRRLQTGLLQEYVYASLFIFAGVVLVSVLMFII